MDPLRSHLVWAVATAIVALLLPAAADGAQGDLTQKPGNSGCVSEDGTGGACADGIALDGSASVTVSPDGKNVYVGSQGGLAIFDRNATTGALTQKPGAAGCIGVVGACTHSDAVDYASSVTVSLDGKNVYLKSGAGIVVFGRNTTTGALTERVGAAGCTDNNGGACEGDAVAISPDGLSAYVVTHSGISIFDRDTATGKLTQKSDTAGCVSGNGFYGEDAGICADGVLLAGTFSVTVSPDGESVYVGSDEDLGSGVAIFDRDASSGELTQKPRPLGCVSVDGYASGEFQPEHACTAGIAISEVYSVAVSPDGENVYAVHGELFDGGLTILDRSAATGELNQLTGTAGCITAAGNGGACAVGSALGGSWTVAVAPGGEVVYVASPGSDSITAFNRGAVTGALTQKPGTAGCVTETGQGGACAEGTALDNPYGVAVSPDGENLYAASQKSDAVAIFDVVGDGPVDDVPPVTTITKKPKKRVKTMKRKARVGVSFTSEAGATFVCALDRVEPRPCVSPYRVEASAKKGDGKKHTISVRATDQAGNVEAKPACVEFIVMRKGMGNGGKRAATVAAARAANAACAAES